MIYVWYIVQGEGVGIAYQILICGCFSSETLYAKVLLDVVDNHASCSELGDVAKPSSNSKLQSLQITDLYVSDMTLK